MDTLDEWIILGRFGRVHGLKGFISVHSFTEPRDSILQYTTWYVNKIWQPLSIIDFTTNEKMLLVKIKGYEQREKATELTNKDITLLKAELPALSNEEFYWHELIGMAVVNQEQRLLGRVMDMLATGSNDVLVVEGEKRYLIPYLPGSFIIKINREQRQILVDWDADF